jgi:serine/threonine-protein kinase
MANLIGQRFGQYDIISLLGKGGMASVYRARQISVDRDVAIKVMKSDLIADDPGFLTRFEREAKTVAALSQAHILKVFDYGQQGDTVYLVMELLTGGSLSSLIRRGPLAVDHAAQILDQITGALDYAHRRGIVHRDLKPANVLLDEGGDAFLTDFGIAKLLRETTALTQSGVAMGTPAYMAPEQWRGTGLDARADIYALV